MFLARLLGLLAPPGCLACDLPAPDPRAALCPACAARLPWLRDCCPRCALPACRRCPAADAAFAAAWAPMAMRGPARALVHALKFDGLLRAADAMAAQMSAMAPAWVLAADGRALVPVPGDPLRRRRRGVDHAALLAAALSARSGVPVRAALRHRPGAPRQVGAGRATRRGAAARAVGSRGPAPALSVLVDDVHTTGATLDACARALRAAGSRQVVAISYARTLPS